MKGKKTIMSSCVPVNVRSIVDFLKLSIAISLVLSLEGCIIGPTYVIPSGGNTAKLKITTTVESQNQQARIFSNEYCWDYPGQIINLLQSMAIGNNTKESTDTVITAGENVTISVIAGIPEKTLGFSEFTFGHETFVGRVINGPQPEPESPICEAFMTFMPKAGSSYHAIYAIDGSPCSLKITELIDGQEQIVTNAQYNYSCSKISKGKTRAQTNTDRIFWEGIRINEESTHEPYPVAMPYKIPQSSAPQVTREYEECPDAYRRFKEMEQEYKRPQMWQGCNGAYFVTK